MKAMIQMSWAWGLIFFIFSQYSAIAQENNGDLPMAMDHFVIDNREASQEILDNGMEPSDSIDLRKHYRDLFPDLSNLSGIVNYRISRIEVWAKSSDGSQGRVKLFINKEYVMTPSELELSGEVVPSQQDDQVGAEGDGEVIPQGKGDFHDLSEGAFPIVNLVNTNRSFEEKDTWELRFYGHIYVLKVAVYLEFDTSPADPATSAGALAPDSGGSGRKGEEMRQFFEEMRDAEISSGEMRNQFGYPDNLSPEVPQDPSPNNQDRSTASSSSNSSSPVSPQGEITKHQKHQKRQEHQRGKGKRNKSKPRISPPLVASDKSPLKLSQPERILPAVTPRQMESTSSREPVGEEGLPAFPRQPEIRQVAPPPVVFSDAPAVDLGSDLLKDNKTAKVEFSANQNNVVEVALVGKQGDIEVLDVQVVFMDGSKRTLSSLCGILRGGEVKSFDLQLAYSVKKVLVTARSRTRAGNRGGSPAAYGVHLQVLGDRYGVQ